MEDTPALTIRIIEILRKELRFFLRDGVFKSHRYFADNLIHFADMCLLSTHPESEVLSIEDAVMANYLCELEKFTSNGGFIDMFERTQTRETTSSERDGARSFSSIEL
jgi:hypothetical protein